MIRLKQTAAHTLDTIFILALLTLFALTSFLVVAIGARQYQSVANTMSQNYETRTVSAYLEEKINQSDIAGSADVCNFSGTDALVLTQTVGETDYSTYIYAYDGYLREITVISGTEFSLDSGQKVVETQALSVESFSGNLFCLNITDTDGNCNPLYLSLNAKQ